MSVNSGGSSTPRQRSQGADVFLDGVRYRTWSAAERVEALIVSARGEILRSVPLAAEGDGYFSGHDEQGRAGDLYRYRLGANDWPDPASRWQPRSVHGASMVIDPDVFTWTDQSYRAPRFADLVIYELHVGTFTPEGTFRALIPKLDHLVALGVNAIELMPIADFPGARNWGYDGVMPYAPARIYGHPDDLRAFVDAAHARGVSVILDVVYNHLGPDGNYVGVYHPDYFHREHATPWGSAFNLEARPVRRFFAENASYWMREFHIDGFRLDATHAIADASESHLLAEISDSVHAADGFVIAEDERNEPLVLTPSTQGGLGFDGCWSDDFHHVVRVLLTGEREGYYANFRGTLAELAETLAHGWLFRGQRRTLAGAARGGETAKLAAEQFVYCISNHDQVGNRALGERLGQATSAAAYRAASALLCFAPQTPMFFMGQEWNAATPFQFFTDHGRDLGRRITEGRRREFRHFAAFADPTSLTRIPDPQAERTFLDSKLDWSELGDPRHAQTVALYREFLALRRLSAQWRKHWRADLIDDVLVALSFGEAEGKWRYLLLVDLTGGHALPALPPPVGSTTWRPLLSSNETRFGGGDERPFQVPTALVYEAH